MKKGKGKALRSNSLESPDPRDDDYDGIEGLVAYMFKLQPGTKLIIFNGRSLK